MARTLIRAQPPFLASPPIDILHTLGQSGGGANSLNLSRWYRPDFTQAVPSARSVLPALFCSPTQSQH